MNRNRSDLQKRDTPGMHRRAEVVRLAGISVLLFVFVQARELPAQAEPGGFFGFGGGATTVNGAAAIMPSIDVGVLVDGRWIVGAELAALVPTVRADSLSATGRTLFVGLLRYGGGLEYVFNPEGFVQACGRLHFGGGSLTFQESGTAHTDTAADNPGYSFGYVQPELAAAFAFNENLRLRLALGWRLAFGRESGSEPAGALSGPTAGLTFRIGWFGKRNGSDER